MLKRLKRMLRMAEIDLETWHADGDCHDPETVEYLEGKIQGLRLAVMAVKESDG